MIATLVEYVDGVYRGDHPLRHLYFGSNDLEMVDVNGMDSSVESVSLTDDDTNYKVPVYGVSDGLGWVLLDDLQSSMGR